MTNHPKKVYCQNCKAICRHPEIIREYWLAGEDFIHRSENRKRPYLLAYFGTDGKCLHHRLNDIVPMIPTGQGEGAIKYKITRIETRYGDRAMWDDGKFYWFKREEGGNCPDYQPKLSVRIRERLRGR